MGHLNKRFFGAILCGMALINGSAAVAEDRIQPIIDGTLVPVSEYPYVAQLSLDGFVCTGTLIASKYVLSAGHCFFDQNNNPNTNYGAMSATLNGVSYGIANVTVHPSYVPRSSACIQDEPDAAVIELASEVSGISPIALQRTEPTVGTSLLLVGFGTQGSGPQGEDGTFPPEGFVNFGSTAIESVDSTYVNWTFDSGQSEANTAGGDSGGPAFADAGGVRYINSITCGGTGNAGFQTTSSNTRVDIIASWVDSIAGSTQPEQPAAFVSLPSQTISANQAFSYTIQATGTAPLNITVNGELPPGLTFNGSAITGTPTVVGTYTVSLTVSNAFGSQNGTLTINVTEFDPSAAITFNRVTVSFDEDDDLVSMRGTIAVGDGFVPNGAAVSIKIAELEDSFTLNRRGVARRAGGFDRIILRGRLRDGAFVQSQVRFVIGLGDNEDLYEQLDQIFPIEPQNGETVQLPVEIVINGITYRATVSMQYRARRDLWLKAAGS